MGGTRAPVEAAGDDGLAIDHSELAWLGSQEYSPALILRGSLGRLVIHQANLACDDGIGSVLATEGSFLLMMAWLARAVGCSQNVVLGLFLEESTTSAGY